MTPTGGRSAFRAIRAIDEDLLGFERLRELSSGWIEYRVGINTLALARPSPTAADPPTPAGSAALQLAFKVVSPPTDQPFGHRTVFFRDPDGNLLEIFAEL